MILFAGLCIGLGIWPEHLYAMLPYTVNYEPYTVPHVVNMLQLLLFSGFAFFVMLPLMKRTLTITLDFDWFYRRIFPIALQNMFSTMWKLDGALRRAFHLKLNLTLGYIERRHAGISSLLSRTYPAGSMMLWVVVILATYLILSFVH